MHAVACVRKALEAFIVEARETTIAYKFDPLVTGKTRYVYAKKVNATNCAKSKNKYNE